MTLFAKRAALTVMGCMTLLGCPENKLEKEFFFEKPASTRIERLRNYSLADQYRLFRYGNDRFEPPLIGLARPIAERGKDAVPFLLKELDTSTDDVAVRDILLVFETMMSIQSYDVRSDSALMARLRSRVQSMKDAGWQRVCFEMLRRIEGPTESSQKQ
jgi:hypothetical protein